MISGISPSIDYSALRLIPIRCQIVLHVTLKVDVSLCRQLGLIVGVIPHRVAHVCGTTGSPYARNMLISI